MVNFEDVIERGSRPKIEDSEPRPKMKIPKPTDSPETSIIDLLNDDTGLGNLVNERVNPEMKSKILIPLANLLDKYGVSDTIANSDTTQNTMSIISLINDISPVIKGMADYVAGQKNSLDAEDREFLEKIKAAQDTGEFSDLFKGGEDMMDIGDAPEPKKNIHPLIGELPEFDTEGPIDWAMVLDPKGELAKENEKKAMGLNLTTLEELPNLPPIAIPTATVSMPSLADLAAEQGVSMDKIAESDSNIKPDKADIEIVESHDDKNVVDILGDIDIMDEFVEVNTEEEIVELTDEEVEELIAQGYELEEVEESLDEEE
tara:strand:+ start:2475 stop:3425 length:951 start_codon:yes stop_codon:yes gene_type:complete